MCRTFSSKFEIIFLHVEIDVTDKMSVETKINKFILFYLEKLIMPYENDDSGYRYNNDQFDPTTTDSRK